MKFSSVRTSAFLLLLALFGGVSTAQSEERPGEGVTVSPAVDTAEASLPLDGIFRLLLDELGYEVADPVTLSNPVFYSSVAEGDVDYWANGWFPLQFAQLPENFFERASIVGAIVEAGGLQGYLVDKESAERLDITSLDDFRREGVREAFDVSGDGLADLVACPPGWGCELVIEHHLDAYDLRDHIYPIKGAYSATFADVVARYHAGEPVFYYTWTPNFTILQLVPGEDVVWINVPEIIPSEAQEGFEEEMVLEGVKGAVTDPVRMGFVANDISPVANNSFLEQNPAIERLFELVTIPLQDISEMTARISEGESSPEEIQAMSLEWIEANRNQVDDWLRQAREAAAQ